MQKEMGSFATLLPLLKGPGGSKEMRSDCSSRELELWSWDAGKQRKFWREKLLSYVGLPRSRTRDGDSCASDLLRECSQEKESEGIRIE